MIRHAVLRDYDRIVQLMVNFANAAPIEDYHNPQYDQRCTHNCLSISQQSGCVLVAEADGEIQGVLIAQIHVDQWMPHIRTLKEVAWWIEPQYRHSSMAGRLLKEYVKLGEKLKTVGAINNFTITLLANSPDLKLEKRGWRAIETNYAYEGKN